MVVTYRRAAMEVTWTIRELTDVVNGLLDTAFGDRIWVEGEIVNMSRAQSGHVYFSLVDPDDDTRTPASLGVTLFKWHRDAVNAQLRGSGGSVRPDDGVRVRVSGSLGIYAAQSKLQLRMTGIDPLFTLGSIAQTRDAIMASLAADGSLDLQKRLAVAFLPQRIGLITSQGSAAHADALSELARAEIGLHVVVCDARVQGSNSAAQLVSALRTLDRAGVDVICLVRGGGAKTDLLAFDHPEVARTIAQCATPVWTGIGHETDRSIADEVAHTAHKTPTACAAAVVAAAHRGGRIVEDRWEDISTRSAATLIEARRRLDRSASSVALRTGSSLSRAGHAVDERGRRLGTAAVAPLDRRALALEAAVDRLAAAAPRCVERADERLSSPRLVGPGARSAADPRQGILDHPHPRRGGATRRGRRGGRRSAHHRLRRRLPFDRGRTAETRPLSRRPRWFRTPEGGLNMTDSPDPTADSEGDGLSYADALRELDEILVDLDNDRIDIDALGTRVARAAELIESCRARLDVARASVEEIIAGLADSAAPGHGGEGVSGAEAPESSGDADQ